ncbi:hypothetical protein [Cellulomonas endophytica]|uniref:hypothetical protein n=1 Tax=Cellulomonas endophytica TaxID=2494735 RepID=UPI001011B3DE|nr:hypothetical protein [Cellulomonas endophytica]
MNRRAVPPAARVRPGRLAGVPAAALLVALAGAPAPALWRHCVAVADLGTAGPLALRLDVLAATAGCPAGTLGLGSTGRSLLVAGALVLSLLGVHLALAAVGTGLLPVAARLVRAAARLLLAAAGVRRRPGPAVPVAARRAPRPRWVVVRRSVLAGRAGPRSHRGPPVVA